MNIVYLDTTPNIDTHILAFSNIFYDKKKKKKKRKKEYIPWGPFTPLTRKTFSSTL